MSGAADRVKSGVALAPIVPLHPKRGYPFAMRTLSELWSVEITAWLVALRAAGRSAQTIATRTEQISWLATWARRRSPWELTTEDLLDFMDEHKGWARETRRGVRSALRGFYRWGLATDRADRDPAAGLPPVRPGEPRPRPATDPAYRAALAAAGPRERLMIRLAAEVGMRRAEVAVVHSRDLLEDLDGWSLLVHGKGDKERLVPLPDGLAAALRRLPRGYAFPGQIDGHLSPRYVGKLVGRLLPEGTTMHALRHRFATLAYQVDHDVFTVQELLGHASPATTRRYVKTADTAKRRLVQAVAA